MDSININTDQLLQIAHEHSPDGVTVLRPIKDDRGKVVDFTWLYQNKTISRLNGTDTEKIIGKRLLDLFPGHAGTTFLEKYIQVAETGETCIFEEGYQGETIEAQTWFRIVVISAGTDIAILAQDITEQKNLELSLKKALEEAEEANRAKSAFLSSMSHELRTPLNAVLGFGQLLNTDTTNPLTDDQIESVNHILKGGEHLLELVNHILDLSKIEAGNLTLSTKIFDPSTALKNCHVMVQNMTEKKSLTFDNQTVGVEMPLIRADETRFKQILLNLLSNAAKYNRENGAIALSFQEMPTGYARFLVRDTGPGIEVEKIDKLFEPFHRLGAEATQIEGVGIGLSIAQSLAKAMEGELGFETELGRGSTFWFELPLA